MPGSRRPRGAPPKTKAGQSPRRPDKTLKLVRNRSFRGSGPAAPPIPENYQKASTPATKIGLPPLAGRPFAWQSGRQISNRKFTWEHRSDNSVYIGVPIKISRIFAKPGE
jgi:hypothetical protein